MVTLSCTRVSLQVSVQACRHCSEAGLGPAVPYTLTQQGRHLPVFLSPLSVSSLLSLFFPTCTPPAPISPVCPLSLLLFVLLCLLSLSHLSLVLYPSSLSSLLISLDLSPPSPLPLWFPSDLFGGAESWGSPSARKFMSKPESFCSTPTPSHGQGGDGRTRVQCGHRRHCPRDRPSLLSTEAKQAPPPGTSPAHPSRTVQLLLRPSPKPAPLHSRQPPLTIGPLALPPVTSSKHP